MAYELTNNYFEIVAGTNNTTSRAYREAAEEVEKNEGNKGLTKLKNFITSIEELADKESVKDNRISSSRGNIEKFQGYENIKSALSFLKKNINGVHAVDEADKVFQALQNYKSLYMDGYEKDIRLVVLEYESAVYILVTTLSMTIANNIDVTQNGSSIKIEKKTNQATNSISKTCGDMSKELSNRNHREYLETLVKHSEDVKSNKVHKVEESVLFMESRIDDTIELIATIAYTSKSIVGGTVKVAKMIKNTVFGIVPLVRSIMYLRYKKKADTILALDQQVKFIEMNIEQLERRANIDPEEKEQIIKKQKAVIESYKKKSAKLRAQLCDNERDASESQKKDNPEMKKDSGSSDNDFVLEAFKEV